MSSKKKRLLKVIDKLGFEKTLTLSKLSGSTLGQYADQRNPAQMPDIKLLYLEMEVKQWTKAKDL